VRQLLKHGQVELSGLEEWPRFPDVDRLDPVAGQGVEDVDVSVAVHLEMQKKTHIVIHSKKTMSYGFLDFYLKQESIKKNLQRQTKFGLDHGYYASKARS
jgi:hypothetical protein